MDSLNGPLFRAKPWHNMSIPGRLCTLKELEGWAVRILLFKPEKVAGLDVPVDDLLVVEVLEPEHHVAEGQPRGPLLQGVLTWKGEH